MIRTRHGSTVAVGVGVPGSGVGMIGVGVGGSGVLVGGTVGGVTFARSVGVGGGRAMPMVVQSPVWFT